MKVKKEYWSWLEMLHQFSRNELAFGKEGLRYIKK